MKNSLILLMLTLIGTVGVAQEVVFKTLASKGTCIIQRGTNPDQYVPVATGVKIFDNDKIIITGDNSYIGLVSTNGKALELTKGGVFNVADLKKLIAGNESNLAERYLELLMDDMSKADENTGRNMKYTGAVERSINDNDIVVFLPETTKIAMSHATVKWYPKADASKYLVKITDLYDEPVFSTNTSSKSVTIDIQKLGLKPGQVYKFSVSSADDPAKNSGFISLNVPSRSEIAKLDTEIARLKEEIPPNSAIGDMILATYLEEQGLFVNAIPYYESAIEKEPDIIEYKNAYNKFLYRIGLGEVALKM